MTLDHAQLMDHLSIGILVLDRSLRVVLWNRWMAEHSLLEREAVLGRRISELFPSLTKKGFIKKCQKVIKEGQPVFFTQKVNQFIFPFPTPRSYLTRELVPMQQTVILSPMKNSLDEIEQVLVSVFDVSDWVEHQNQLLASKQELEKLSQVDELTQIPNRRAIMEKLREELSMHNRKQRQLGLAMVDIDHFKKINDTHGHQGGDHVLYELATLFANKVRGYDLVGRYGGEEFVLLFPETASEEAVQACERLRRLVSEAVFRYEGREIRISISIGLAVKPAAESIDAEALLRQADDCLYLAKKGGRNQLVKAC